MTESTTHRASSVTPVEHTMIGAAGGAVEVCIMQPLVGVKNALQVRIALGFCAWNNSDAEII